MARTIRVEFSVKEWNALHSCARGELESLTDADWENGNGDDLLAAKKKMEDARHDYS